MWLMGRYFVWDKKVDRWQIAEERFQRNLHQGFNVLLILFGIFGLGAMVWQALEQKVVLDLDSILEFLSTRNIWKILASISFLGDLIVSSRIVKARQERILVAHRDSELLSVPAPEISWPDVIREETRFENIAPAFLAAAQKVVEGAWTLAERLKNPEVMPIHIFAALFAFHDTQVVFGRLGIGSKSLSQRVNHVLAKMPTTPNPPKLGQAATEILLRAYLESVMSSRPIVNVAELIVAVGYDQEVNPG
jgi:hypothetical protein